MTDIEELERAFLSALQKHFKKPGPWLPSQPMAANTLWPDVKSVPYGQVWEVYIYDSVGGTSVYLNGQRCFGAMRAGRWYPLAYEDAEDDGMFTQSGAGDGATYTTTLTERGSMASQGIILNQGEWISCNQAYVVRARRRFDLET